MFTLGGSEYDNSDGVIYPPKMKGIIIIFFSQDFYKNI